MASRGWQDVTMADVQRMRHRQPTTPKRAKYGSVKTTVDGIQFDSAKEARRYQELLNLVCAGHLRDLRTQPHYVLFALSLDNADLHNCNAGHISVRRQPVCEYIADFEYEERWCAGAETWVRVVEDVKSPATRCKEVYRLKRKLFEAQYGIEIREV